jgi:protein-L-isoaspartate(D-aspartate) O-methyltransferase
MAGAPGEPAAARARMVGELRRHGTLTSAEIADAFLAVPRHVFLPEIGAADAYADQAFVIKTDANGRPLSSSSQPTMMAIMLEQLGISPGERVLEVGTGTGYNAALMARLAGERGLVVTVDIDPGLVARARANLAVAATGPAPSPAASPAANPAARPAADVILICGDGGFGAPDYAPYDKIIVTAGAWDLAPQWLGQLGPGGRIVVPLSVRGSQLSVALERADGHWRSRSVCPCGFILMSGAFGSAQSFLPVGPQPGLQVRTEDGRALDTAALYAALTGPGVDVPTGVRVAGLARLFEADLWVTLTLPDVVRAVIAGRGPLRHAVLSERPEPGALAESGAFAVAGLWPAGWEGAPEPAAGRVVRPPPRKYLRGEFEVTVRGFGPGGADLAGRLASQVAAWQDAGRPGASDLTLAAYPGPVPDLPGQVVLGRRHTTLALSWPSGHRGGDRGRLKR